MKGDRVHQRAVTTVNKVVRIPVEPQRLGEAFLKLVAIVDGVQRGWRVSEIAVTVEQEVPQQ